MVLTAIYPVWFAQSTLAHADMFAAAFTLWAITFCIQGEVAPQSEAVIPRPPEDVATANAISAAGLFSLAALAKETAIVLPAALFLLHLWRLVSYMRARKEKLVEGKATPPGISTLRTHCIWLMAFAFPALPLGFWYLYHRSKTGFTFGNPEYLRYNATANLSAARVALSLWHRLIHLTVHMNLFLPVLAAIALLLLPARTDSTGKATPFLPRPAVQTLLVLLVAQWVAFSVLGGALLTRYLLPAYPMVLLLCVAVWKSRVRWWPAVAVLSLVGFAIGCEHNPPYPFAPEDNLSYRDMIVVHQHAIRYLQQHRAGSSVLTAWPVEADLQRPELGYLKTPMHTVHMENFTAEEVAKAAANAEQYDTALVFSTKYDPPPGGLNLAGESRRNDTRFYDYHRDLLPGEIAARLGGRIAWQEDIKGEWAAVIEFPRGYDALLNPLRQ
jgi:hypothetical protein